jgi:hypothetical protein
MMILAFMLARPEFCGKRFVEASEKGCSSHFSVSVSHASQRLELQPPPILFRTEFDNLAEHSSTNMPPLRRWFPRPCVIEYLELKSARHAPRLLQNCVRHANPRP